ncbi:hypothetical protein CYMTET_45932, partial [Cymbomonas tetramitiformis]
DFPDELLEVITRRQNVCKQLHLPAQSGSSTNLQRMRRGYTREAYLELVDHVRAAIPHVALSSDFISGFCEETEEEHRDTVTLMEQVIDAIVALPEICQCKLVPEPVRATWRRDYCLFSTPWWTTKALTFDVTSRPK